MYLRPGNRIWLSAVVLLFFVAARSASSVLQTDNDLVFEDADQLEKNILNDKWHDNLHNKLVDIVHQSIKRVKRDFWTFFPDTDSTTPAETTQQSDSTSISRHVRTTDDITTTTPAAVTTTQRGDTSMTDDEDDNNINSGDGEGSGDAEDNRSTSKTENKSTTSLTSPFTTTQTSIQNITTTTAPISSTTTVPTPTVPYDPFAPSQVLIIYRVYMTVNEPYISDYANSNSEPFSWLANNFSLALTEALRSWINDVEPRVVEIKPSADNFLTEVTVDIETTDRHPQETLETFLKYFVDHSRDYNPSITVIDKGFRVVRAYTGRKHRCFPGDKLCLPTDTCLPPEATCNGKLDCPDGSDEQNCPTTTTSRLRTAINSFNSTCAPGQFQCDGGRCILSWRRCNGVEDCLDRTDELGCSRTSDAVCDKSQFQCQSDKVCIDSRRRCDRYNDCTDGSDEVDCDTCTSEEFQCYDGKCLNIDKRCNGKEECSTGEDEVNCGPPVDPGSGKLISITSGQSGENLVNYLTANNVNN